MKLLTLGGGGGGGENVHNAPAVYFVVLSF